MGCGASAQDQDDRVEVRRSNDRKATPWHNKSSSQEGLTLSQQLSAGGNLGDCDDNDSESEAVQVARSVADDRGPLPEGAVAVFLDWSTCEFDIAMPHGLCELPLTEDLFNEFMWILNFELLESFAEKWRADAAASLAKSVLKGAVKGVAKELSGFVMPPPGKVVLGAFEQVAETVRQKMRRQDWDGRVVPQLKLWLEVCDQKAESMGTRQRFKYLDAELTPVQLADLETRRRQANSLLKLADAQEAVEERAGPEAGRRLREVAVAFNQKVEHVQAQVDEVRNSVENKVEELPGQVQETLSEALCTRLPCVIFSLPA